MRASLVALLLALASAAPVHAGLRLVVASLDLELETPNGWKISTCSTPSELVLEPVRSGELPLLRVRSIGADASERALLPRELMRAIALSLEGPERDLAFVSESAFGDGSVLVEASAASVSLRMVYVPRGERGPAHVFWLAGASADLRRHWAAVEAAVASSGRTADVAGEEERVEKQAEEASASALSFHDAKSGLCIARWPKDFVVVERTLTDLSTSGIVWVPEKESDAGSARVTLTRLLASPMVTPDSVASTIAAELRERGVRAVRTKKTRVAELQALELAWQEADELATTWLFKRVDALFRIDYRAKESWVLAPGREGLESFLAGVSFAD